MPKKHREVGGGTEEGVVHSDSFLREDAGHLPGEKGRTNESETPVQPARCESKAREHPKRLRRTRRKVGNPIKQAANRRSRDNGFSGYDNQHHLHSEGEELPKSSEPGPWKNREPELRWIH